MKKTFRGGWMLLLALILLALCAPAAMAYEGYQFKTSDPSAPPSDLYTPSPALPTYTVTFYANEGEGEMEPQKFVSGKKQELTLNTFTREYFTFTGWNTQPDGSGDIYEDGQEIAIFKSMDLYAQWQPPELTDDMGIVIADSGAYKNNKGVYQVLKGDGTARLIIPGYEVKEWISAKPKKLKIDPATGVVSFTKTGSNLKATAMLENGKAVEIKLSIIKNKSFAQDISFQAKVNGKWQEVKAVELAPSKSVPTRLVANDKGKIVIQSVTFSEDGIVTRGIKATAPIKARKAKFSDGKSTTMTIVANGQTFVMDISVSKAFGKDLTEETVAIEEIEELE